MEYINTPKIKTRKELMEGQKQSLLAENDASALTCYSTYMPPQNRIALREDLRRDYFEAEKAKKYGGFSKSSSVVNVSQKGLTME